MFDINMVSRRYFTIKLDEMVLEVEPPKLKTMKRLMAVAKNGNAEAMEDLTEAMGLILNKNRKGTSVPQEIIEELTIDQMQEILSAFFGWVGKAKNDPN